MGVPPGGDTGISPGEGTVPLGEGTGIPPGVGVGVLPGGVLLGGGPCIPGTCKSIFPMEFELLPSSLSMLCC